MKRIFTELHVYDEDVNYVPFDYEKPEPLFNFFRKVVPNVNA